MPEQKTLGYVDPSVAVDVYALAIVRPVHHKERRGTKYQDGYDFISIHPDDMDIDDFPEEVCTCRTELGLWYKYGDTAPILITDDEVYKTRRGGREQAQRNAYFALSIMDEYGCVSGWRKR